MPHIDETSTVTWAIRDIKHGKTYYFKTYENMAAWIKSNQDKMT